MPHLEILAAVLSVAIISALSAAGYVVLSFHRNAGPNIIYILVSLAVGVLFGDVFFHLLPELFSDPMVRGAAGYLTLGGLLLFFVLEKFLRWRHCHLSEGEGHYHPMVGMTLAGDAMHNFIDGLAIGSAYSLSLGLGLATSLAIFCHELPAELGRYGVLVAGGVPPRRALYFNFLSTITSFAGMLLALLAFQVHPAFASAVSGITAGGFLYVAGSDLVPDLHHETGARRSLVQFAAIAVGLGVMILVKVWLD
jgi:zinc and cadmium transporter